MALSIKVKAVRPLDNMVLSVLFENGVSKTYDVKQLLPFRNASHSVGNGMFEPLRDNPALFKNVYVDCGGYGIAWNSDIDISECELWENGVITA